MITPQKTGHRIAPAVEHQILSLARETTLGHRKIAATIKVGEATVRRVLRRQNVDRSRIAERNQLVEEHRPLAEGIARQVAGTIPFHMRADLASVASVALIRAADSFDPSKGVPFGAYLQPRVRGACIDSVKGRRYRDASGAELTRHTSESRREPSASAETTMIEDQQRANHQKAVRAAIQKLPCRLGIILWLRYVEGQTLEEVAPKLGIVASRVSQLHSEGVRQAREVLAGTAAPTAKAVVALQTEG